MQINLFYKKTLIIWIALSSISCSNNETNQLKFTDKDTTNLIQSALSDKQLEADILKDFGNQPLKLVVGQVIKPTQQFQFAGKPAKIVSVAGDVYEIHEHHPKGLYVSIPDIKFFSADSATVSLIFHAGNATSSILLKKERSKWVVKKRQDGKF